jgi:hypothetical protein
MVKILWDGECSRCFGPRTAGRLVRLASLFEKRDELPQPGLRQVPELPVVATADRLVEGLQQFQSSVRDANFDDAAIPRGAIATNQLATLQLVEHPRDVGSPGNEPFSQSQRR